SLFRSVPRRPPSSTLCPSTTLFRSEPARVPARAHRRDPGRAQRGGGRGRRARRVSARPRGAPRLVLCGAPAGGLPCVQERSFGLDRKSTRLNSSHVKISYAVFCLKK